MTGTFDFEDVCFHYKNNEHNVLNHLNLHVKAGETIALVGESGAGKSTILNLVIGFHQAESGKVLIDGKDLSKIFIFSRKIRSCLFFYGTSIIVVGLNI